MIHLRSLVNDLNQAFALRIKETAKLNGLVRPIHRQREGQNEITNVDNLNHPVVIDDRYSINLWHRVTSIDSKELVGRGKGNRYQFQAKMILICSSKQEITHDLLVFVISRYAEYSSSDFDITRIIRQETGKSDVNINNSLFQINYTINYLSEKCFDDCFAAALPSVGSSDCIEVTQGGNLQP